MTSSRNKQVALGPDGLDDLRVSQTALQGRAGRIPKRAFDRLVETGLLNSPGPDNRWPASELDRIDEVMALGRQARDLHRRVLLLPWEGPQYEVSPQHRRRAVEELLKGDLRPAASKMRAVRRALHLLHRRTVLGLGWQPARRPRSYGMRVARELWWRAVHAADDETFAREYQVASFYAQILPTVSDDEPVGAVPPEERLAFVLVNLLLRHPEPRQAVGLPPLPIRRGLEIQE